MKKVTKIIAGTTAAIMLAGSTFVGGVLIIGRPDSMLNYDELKAIETCDEWRDNIEAGRIVVDLTYSGDQQIKLNEALDGMEETFDDCERQIRTHRYIDLDYTLDQYEKKLRAYRRSISELE